MSWRGHSLLSGRPDASPCQRGHLSLHWELSPPRRALPDRPLVLPLGALTATRCRPARGLQGALAVARAMGVDGAPRLALREWGSLQHPCVLSRGVSQVSGSPGGLTHLCPGPWCLAARLGCALQPLSVPRSPRCLPTPGPACSAAPSPGTRPPGPPHTRECRPALGCGMSSLRSHRRPPLPPWAARREGPHRPFPGAAPLAFRTCTLHLTVSWAPESARF